jgi:Epoxide hydrolase N terminus
MLLYAAAPTPDPRMENGMTGTIEPFRIDIPQAQLDDLRLRLTRTRWPDRQPVPDWWQGIPLDVVTELCRCWQEQYDWRATEQRLNQIPQFRVTVDDLLVRHPHAHLGMD